MSRACYRGCYLDAACLRRHEERNKENAKGEVLPLRAYLRSLFLRLHSWGIALAEDFDKHLDAVCVPGIHYNVMQEEALAYHNLYDIKPRDMEGYEEAEQLLIDDKDLVQLAQKYGDTKKLKKKPREQAIKEQKTLPSPSPSPAKQERQEQRSVSTSEEKEEKSVRDSVEKGKRSVRDSVEKGKRSVRDSVERVGRTS